MDQPTISAEIPPEPEPEPELIEGQWKPGAWQGIPQLTCVLCKWDTLDGIEAAREHKEKCPRCHPPEPPAPPPPLIQRYDRWDRPVGPPAVQE